MMMMNSQTNKQSQKQQDSARRIKLLNSEELRNVAGFYYYARGIKEGYTRVECRELMKSGEIYIPAGFIKKYANKDPEQHKPAANKKEQQNKEQQNKEQQDKEQPKKEETTAAVASEQNKPQRSDCFNFYNCTVTIYQHERARVICVDSSTQTQKQAEACTQTQADACTQTQAEACTQTQAEACAQTQAEACTQIQAEACEQITQPDTQAITKTETHAEIQAQPEKSEEQPQAEKTQQIAEEQKTIQIDEQTEQKQPEENKTEKNEPIQQQPQEQTKETQENDKQEETKKEEQAYHTQQEETQSEKTQKSEFNDSDGDEYERRQQRKKQKRQPKKKDEIIKISLETGKKLNTIQANKCHDETVEKLLSDCVLQFTNLDSEVGPVGQDFYGHYMHVIGLISEGKPETEKGPASPETIRKRIGALCRRLNQEKEGEDLTKDQIQKLLDICQVHYERQKKKIQKNTEEKRNKTSEQVDREHQEFVKILNFLRDLFESYKRNQENAEKQQKNGNKFGDGFAKCWNTLLRFVLPLRESEIEIYKTGKSPEPGQYFTTIETGKAIEEMTQMIEQTKKEAKTLQNCIFPGGFYLYNHKQQHKTGPRLITTEMIKKLYKSMAGGSYDITQLLFDEKTLKDVQNYVNRSTRIKTLKIAERQTGQIQVQTCLRVTLQEYITNAQEYNFPESDQINAEKLENFAKFIEEKDWGEMKTIQRIRDQYSQQITTLLQHMTLQEIEILKGHCLQVSEQYYNKAQNWGV